MLALKKSKESAMRKGGIFLTGLGVALATLLATAPAEARNLYFDIWCQEQGYSKDRCDQRTATDVAAFEEYWRIVEKYEEPYYVQRQGYQDFKEELNALDEGPTPGFQSFDPIESPRAH
jgi:hypothetical protein